MKRSQQPDYPGQGGGDPWAAFGYLVSGVAVYGLIGLGLSKWLHAGYWIPIGILVGAVAGMYLVFAQYRVHPPTDVKSDAGSTAQQHPEQDSVNHTDQAARQSRPEDDRGETA